MRAKGRVGVGGAEVGAGDICCDREPSCYSIESLANQMCSRTATCLADLCSSSPEVKAVGLRHECRGFAFVLHLRKWGKPAEIS